MSDADLIARILRRAEEIRAEDPGHVAMLACGNYWHETDVSTVAAATDAAATAIAVLRFHAAEGRQ